MRGSGGARERARYGSACCVACPLADASVVLGPQGAGRPDSIAGARERARYGSACCVACPLADACVMLGPSGVGRSDSTAGARKRARYGRLFCRAAACSEPLVISIPATGVAFQSRIACDRGGVPDGECESYRQGCGLGGRCLIQKNRFLLPPRFSGSG